MPDESLIKDGINAGSDLADALTPDGNPLPEELNPGTIVDTLTPDPNNPVVVVVTEIVNKTADTLKGLLGDAFENIDTEALSDLSGEQQQALLDFVNAVKLLQELGGKAENLQGRFEREVLGKSFQVATRAENMQLAADLSAALFSAYEALTAVFKALKALTRQIPELGDPVELFPAELKDHHPRFRAWVSSL